MSATMNIVNVLIIDMLLHIEDGKTGFEYLVQLRGSEFRKMLGHNSQFGCKITAFF